ncbi:MAG: haloalkane dehalogenase [Pseudomonadota bacterium]
MSQRNGKQGLLSSIGAAASSLVLSGCMSVLPALAPRAKNVEPNISDAFPYQRQFIEVNGSTMAYVEAGDPAGAPILLIHGNPTSAYLWRNVIPHLEGSGRVIAVDLIGMGESDKPDIDYRFADHAAYLEGFIDAMALQGVFLVLHDWGGGLGVDYAARHEHNVRGIAMLEMAIKPMSLKDADFGTRFVFGRLRDPEAGEKLIQDQNFFVENMLPMMSGRKLTEAEMAAYRAPYATRTSRKPLRQWPLEIPLDGTPADNHERIGDNYIWLAQSDVPLLMMYADPGMIWTRKTRKELFEDLPRMQAVSVGSGLHYLQEVQPTRIGRTVRDWILHLSESSAPISHLEGH